jgi:hypothetical protein
LQTLSVVLFVAPLLLLGGVVLLTALKILWDLVAAPDELFVLGAPR